MQKYRIYELAKFYSRTSEEIIDILKKNNIEVKSNFNSVDQNAKEILDREMTPQEGKKKFRRSGMRTVRFDQQGRPQTKKKLEEPGHRQSAPAVQAHPGEAEKKAADSAPVSAQTAAAPVQVRSHNQTETEIRKKETVQVKTERNRTESSKEHSREQGRRENSSSASSGNSRTASGTRSFRSASPGTAHHDRSSETKNGQFHGGAGRNTSAVSTRRPGAAPAKPTGSAPSPVHKDKPAHRKKDKKDYEKVRKERQGTSLMAQSMKQHKKKRHLSDKRPTAIEAPKEVRLPQNVTVKDLAALFGHDVGDIIKHLMSLGIMATINQNVDPDAAALLADEFGITLLEPEVKQDPTVFVPSPDNPRMMKVRPPVVTIMGHVDHGKTTLLDAIRSTDVASHEAGGITQRIGAYQIRYKNQKITFLDTPGHEAFTAMRTRGAQITDIAVIIVAADDGVMPQTIEAIHHAKNAQVPIVVAINKVDKPGANIDHIKEQLSQEGLISEDWGGDVIMIPISAKKKMGLEDLLDNILLVAEVQELKANPSREAYGVVVEAQLDKGRGPVMTVLVQNGTLRVGDGILAGRCWGRVRAMTNENGRKLEKAEPSAPAEIIGMNDVPEAGDHFYVMDEKKARELASMRATRAKAEEQSHVQKVTLDNIFEKIEEGEMKELNLIIKADVQGSAEALLQSFAGIKSEKVRISIVHSAVGAINESDVMLASASNALILGFNVRPDANARKLAETEKVDIRLYRVIYDAIDDVKAAMTGLLAPKIKEVLLGHAEVRQVIRTPKVIVAGSYVTDGKITSNSKIRLVRDGVVIHEGQIASLRRFKDDVKEVAEGYECGIAIDSYRDVKEGDTVEAYKLEETAAELE
jgi:translation initiation factor IF-2